jgi:hypothetical protein
MKMRIVVPAAGHRRGLAERLITVFGPDRVSPAEEQHEVDVRVEGPWDAAVLRVVATVEQWLDEIAANSTEMWLGEHSYRISRYSPAKLPRLRR